MGWKVERGGNGLGKGGGTGASFVVGNNTKTHLIKMAQVRCGGPAVAWH